MEIKCDSATKKDLPLTFVKEDDPTYSLETEDAQMSEVQLIVTGSAIYP